VPARAKRRAQTRLTQRAWFFWKPLGGNKGEARGDLNVDLKAVKNRGSRAPKYQGTGNGGGRYRRLPELGYESRTTGARRLSAATTKAGGESGNAL